MLAHSSCNYEGGFTHKAFLSVGNEKKNNEGSSACTLLWKLKSKTAVMEGYEFVDM